MIGFSGGLRIDPRPFTFGELWGMWEAADSLDWNHTAALMTLIAGIVSKTGPKFEEIHPYKKRQRFKGAPLTGSALLALKERFPKLWGPGS